MVLWNFDVLREKLWYYTENYGDLYYFGQNSCSLPKTVELIKGKTWYYTCTIKYETLIKYGKSVVLNQINETVLTTIIMEHWFTLDQKYDTIPETINFDLL